MATGICYLDERDLQADFSLEVTALDGWPGGLGTASREVDLLDGPEMWGALIDPRLIRPSASRATITGVLDTASMATARIALDALYAAVGEGEVRVRTIYAPDRYCLATLDQSSGEPDAIGIVNGVVKVTLGFLIKDSVAFRTQSDGYGLSTSRTACPVGTDHSAPMILLYGGGATLTNPSIVIRNGAGDPVQSMGFSTASLGGGVLGATDYLLVDSVRAAISKSLAGTLSAAESLWTSGDFPLLRPADGWVEDAIYPTVELTATAGTPKGMITYRRSYR